MGLFRGETSVDLTLAGNTTLASTLATQGITAGTNATAGYLGEVVSAIKAVGAPVSIATTNTPVNVLSISLSAGDWDVSGTVNFTAGSATTSGTAGFAAGINTTSATIPVDGSEVNVVIPAVTTSSFLAGTTVAKKRINVTGTTTVYLVANANFSAGTVGAYGAISARRIR